MTSLTRTARLPQRIEALGQDTDRGETCDPEEPDGEGDEPCTVEGEEATLVLWAPDYDGGHKAWVRWPDGRDDIVPGSRVSR